LQTAFRSREAAFDAVDISGIKWNQIEEYIFKWYPLLQNTNLASL